MNIVFLTDLHLGNNKVPVKMVYENLETYFYPRLEHCDLLIIGGDFFDALVNMDGLAGFVANTIIQDLRRFANMYQFPIRGIRGTFSHDRNQLQHFSIERDKKHPQMVKGVQAVRIFDNVVVETIDPLNISLLYIPDDMACDDLMDVCQNALDSAHIDKVDIVVHHGYCSELLPPGSIHIPPNTYSCEDYKELYKGVMLNGHIHLPQVIGTFISGGSFERLHHGEEDDRGFFVITYDPKSCRSRFEFVVNEGSIPFITIVVGSSDDVNNRIRGFQEKVERLVLNCRNDRPIHIRVEINNVDDRFVIKEWMRQFYPEIHLTFKLKGDNNLLESTDVVKLDHHDLPVLTPDNILEHVCRYLRDKRFDMDEEYVLDLYPALAPRNGVNNYGRSINSS